MRTDRRIASSNWQKGGRAMRQEEFVACVEGMERALYRVAKTILRSDADCADAVQ